MGINGNTAFQRILGSAMSHFIQGNVVEVVTISNPTADSDLGIEGTPTPSYVVLDPEPLLSAVSSQLVAGNGGTYRYSDSRLSILKPLLTEAQGTDPNQEFRINGAIYIVVSFTPCPSTWEFVVRRKAP
jgi:hypothetical protein